MRARVPFRAAPADLGTARALASYRGFNYRNRDQQRRRHDEGQRRFGVVSQRPKHLQELQAVGLRVLGRQRILIDQTLNVRLGQELRHILPERDLQSQSI